MKCLIIGYVWPEITSSAAGLRTHNVIDALKVRGWDVHVASPSKPNDFKKALEDQGISTQMVAANSDRFDHYITLLQPDMVIFDRFVMEEQFSWRVRRACPQAMRVLDTQDIHFLRRSRRRALEAGKDINQIAHCDISFEHDDTHRELASILRSDLTLVISDFEMQLLQERFQIPAELLHLWRFSYEPLEEATKRDRPPFEKRRDFVMMGNFRHPPNADAVRYLKQELWPLIHEQLPNVECHVYGAYAPKDAMRLGDPDTHFKVKGWARDQHETFRQYRVSLAPLRFGAGIKGKISDSWWNGTPVVTTAIGAEGMYGDNPFGGLITNDPMQFARSAVDLYRDESFWKGYQKNGYQVIQNLYHFRRNAVDLLDRLTLTRREQEARRARNVMGNMLWLQSNRSVEYFSRWIQLKNEGSDTKS